MKKPNEHAEPTKVERKKKSKIKSILIIDLHSQYVFTKGYFLLTKQISYNTEHLKNTELHLTIRTTAHITVTKALSDVISCVVIVTHVDCKNK